MYSTGCIVDIFNLHKQLLLNRNDTYSLRINFTYTKTYLNEGKLLSDMYTLLIFGWVNCSTSRVLPFIKVLIVFFTLHDTI